MIDWCYGLLIAFMFGAGINFELVTTDDWEVVPSSVELRWRPDDHQAAFTFSS